LRTIDNFNTVKENGNHTGHIVIAGGYPAADSATAEFDPVEYDRNHPATATRFITVRGWLPTRGRIAKSRCGLWYCARTTTAALTTKIKIILAVTPVHDQSTTGDRAVRTCQYCQILICCIDSDLLPDLMIGYSNTARFAIVFEIVQTSITRCRTIQTLPIGMIGKIAPAIRQSIRY
jgi:hypothetical protein